MAARVSARPGAAEGAGVPPGELSSAGVRRLCLWLGQQTAYDRGLVGRLVKAHGTFADVLAQPQAALARALRPRAADEAPVELGAACSDTAVAAGEAGAHEAVIAWCDADYPPGLRELFDPPPVLYLRGREWREMLRALRLRPTVAVVGARRPSPYGLEMAWLLGSGLARAGVNVVSGMALGIDAQAHVGALDGLDAAGAAARDGAGVALAGVLGAGVRLAVPRTNAELFVALERRGLLLSEYGWLLPPHPWHFPARNRVIAALADAVVIVEGDARSGALHTAAFAVDLGRDVLAVPGEAGRPLSAGPHRLLRDGAHLCEAPGDVLDLLPEGAWRRGDQRPDAAICSSESGLEGSESVGGADGPPGRRQGPEARVLAALRRGQHTADQLQQALGLTPATVAAALSALEIDGLLEVRPGGRYHARRDGRRAAGR
jgi:DNA processing protein